MFKKIIFALIFLIFNLGKSQIERNYGDTAQPVPSASSFSSYVNTPVSLSTGIPSIGIPLLSLPTGNKDFEIMTSLSYHPYNTGQDKPASEVGLGWSLFKGGAVISRVINGAVDEFNYDATKSSYKKNLFDDIYYYDLPGNSGKFKFVRDTINNTFTLNNISGSNVKIEYTRDSNTATLVLNSFKITDSKGFKYVFEDYSIARYDTSSKGFNYKSAFYLTKVIDENNITIATFNYQKNSKNVDNSSILLYQNCKMESINTSYGRITFENLYTGISDDDPYIIKSLSLLDMSSHLIAKYRLDYGSFYSSTYPNNVNQGKRTLLSIQKLDRNQNLIEGRQFTYDGTGSETNYGASPNPNEYGNFLCPDNTKADPKTYTLGLLKKMTLPEGGYVVYNFEANEVYENKSNLQLDTNQLKDPALQYLNIANTVNYNTNSSRSYTFQVSTSQKFFIKLLIDEVYEIVNIHGNIILPPTYKLLNSIGNEVTGTANGCSENVKYYNLAPGTYTFKISGNGNGRIQNYGIVNLSAPYKNTTQLKIGARIANIKYYDTDNTVKKAMSYKYDLFDNSGTSGKVFSGEVCNEELGNLNQSVLYSNVKEIYGGSPESQGYSQYYFKTPDDYTSTINFYKPYYNVTSTGLLTKKEMYNQQNQLISSENTDYVLDEIGGVQEYIICGGYKSKSAWLKSTTTTSKTFYANGSSLQGTTETTFNTTNFQPAYTKNTSPDGKITETTIKYPLDLSNTRLINANMLSVPVQTETKVNGSVVSKGGAKYEFVDNLYPSSVVTFEMKDLTPITTMTYDVYDTKGNPVQIKGKNGIPTVTIWGYYQTLPIAEIAGVTYSQISSLPSVLAAINASNADADNPANEASLLQALENLRRDPALQSNPVTIYTYDPLIGITNAVSSNGAKVSYVYDSANRLVKTMDSDGKTLQEYQYNYKH
ncbi:hypothetical protein CQ046_13570 [Chryseobacterium sp. MYb7]|uniref:hypothetical protein n=1 Tax=Chryseobacterium sp. MYb7 TaxID=1827290 RepID=UPI000CFE4B7D|nr:hypothetical protein [Chryseobacterium sp. MYb7]PRB01989.1 hypothetical protein CQ046_13570 [Chryseobacterium sp. MYb7]